jgi:hypothetical protein
LFGCVGRVDCARSTKEYSVVSSKSGRSSEYASDEIDDSDVVDKEMVELLFEGMTALDVTVSVLWREAKRPETRG